jgi:hypothetical protein
MNCGFVLLALSQAFFYELWVCFVSLITGIVVEEEEETPV